MPLHCGPNSGSHCRLRLHLPTTLVRGCVWCQQVIGLWHVSWQASLWKKYPWSSLSYFHHRYNCWKTRRVHYLLVTMLFKGTEVMSFTMRIRVEDGHVSWEPVFTWYRKGFHAGTRSFISMYYFSVSLRYRNKISILYKSFGSDFIPVFTPN